MAQPIFCQMPKSRQQVQVENQPPMRYRVFRSFPRPLRYVKRIDLLSLAYRQSDDKFQDGFSAFSTSLVGGAFAGIHSSPSQQGKEFVLQCAHCP